MMSLLRNRLKTTLASKAEGYGKRDFPMIKQNLIKNSRDDDYEGARCEWEYVGLVQDEEAIFSDRCELCNQRPLRLNFQIANQTTKKTLLVGSACIKKFITLKGTTSAAESWDYFVRESYNIVDRIDLKGLLSYILMDIPESRYVMAFRRIAIRLLGGTDNIKIGPSKWDSFIESLLGKKNIYDKERSHKIERIRNVLFAPRNIKMKKVKLETGQEAGHWAAMGRKKARVTNTLSI